MIPSHDNLDALASRSRITEMLLLYCRALDRCDADLMKSLYWEDAIDEHGVFDGGAADFADYIVSDTRRRFTATAHMLTNIVIDLQGDSAITESYLIANCTLEGDRAAIVATFGETYAQRWDWDAIAGIPHEFSFGGRYFDRFERRAGEWRISKRQLLQDWNRCDIARSIFDEGMLRELRPRGARRPDDLLYSFGR